MKRNGSTPSGNVWEWCADPWHDDYRRAPNYGVVWDYNENDKRYQNYNNENLVSLRLSKSVFRWLAFLNLQLKPRQNILTTQGAGSTHNLNGLLWPIDFNSFAMKLLKLDDGLLWVLLETVDTSCIVSLVQHKYWLKQL